MPSVILRGVVICHLLAASYACNTSRPASVARNSLANATTSPIPAPADDPVVPTELKVDAAKLKYTLPLELCIVTLLDPDASDEAKLRAIESFQDLSEVDRRVVRPAIELQNGQVPRPVQGTGRIAAMLDTSDIWWPDHDPAKADLAATTTPNRIAAEWARAYGGWRDAPRLADFFDHPDSRVRRLARDILVTWLIGPDATRPPPTRPLYDVDPDVRLRLAEGLVQAARNDDDRVAAHLVACLRRLVWDRPELAGYVNAVVASRPYVARSAADDGALEALLAAPPPPRGPDFGVREFLARHPTDNRGHLDDSAAAAVRRMPPATKAAIARLAVNMFAGGNPAALEYLPLVTRPAAASPPPELLTALKAEGDPALRRRAARVLHAMGVRSPAVNAAWATAINDPDEQVRNLAAAAIGTPVAADWARLNTLLRDLRDPDPGARLRAAHQVAESHLVEPDVAAALLRACRNRDMPAREGLLLAIEHARAALEPTADALQRAADQSADPTARAFARAALRELATAADGR